LGLLDACTTAMLQPKQHKSEQRDDNVHLKNDTRVARCEIVFSHHLVSCPAAPPSMKKLGAGTHDGGRTTIEAAKSGEEAHYGKPLASRENVPLGGICCLRLSYRAFRKGASYRNRWLARAAGGHVSASERLIPSGDEESVGAPNRSQLCLRSFAHRNLQAATASNRKHISRRADQAGHPMASLTARRTHAIFIGGHCASGSARHNQRP
jgi:hypothetical protein